MELLELAFQDNLYPKKVSVTNGGEFHSSCPSCGGKDRFIIWDLNNRYFCRRCEKTGDLIQYFRDFHGLSFKEACIKANIGSVINYKSNLKKSYSNNFSKDRPVDPNWQKKALDFVYNCHKKLLNSREALSLLSNRGFTLDSIKRFYLGWNPNSICNYWQIEKKQRKIWLPKGIVIPSFFDRQIKKIKIRRSDWNKNDNFPKYVEISGSASGPAVYGLNYNLPAVILESELDAMLTLQKADEICFVIALGGATKKPNIFIKSLLDKSKIILLSLDYDEAGIKASKWWKKHYKNLIIWLTPFEKSVGDAFKKELDIKRWISVGIQQYLANE
jgi:DNA primase